MKLRIGQVWRRHSDGYEEVVTTLAKGVVNGQSVDTWKRDYEFVQHIADGWEPALCLCGAYLMPGEICQSPHHERASLLADDAVIADLEELTPKQFADKYGIRQRTVSRWRVSVGIAKSKASGSRPSPEDLVRIGEMGADGVPASWIAEDFGRKPSSIRDILADNWGITPDGEWAKVHLEVMKDAKLARLHAEFAPKS